MAKRTRKRDRALAETWIEKTFEPPAADRTKGDPEAAAAQAAVLAGEERTAWIVDAVAKVKIGPFAPSGQVAAWREQHAPGRAILMNDDPLLGQGEWAVTTPQAWIADKQRASAERGSALAERAAEQRASRPAEVELPEGAILTTAGQAFGAGWEVWPFGTHAQEPWLDAGKVSVQRGSSTLVLARPPMVEPPAELVDLLCGVRTHRLVAKALAERLIADGWIARDRLDG